MCNSEFKIDNMNDNGPINMNVSKERTKYEEHKRFKSADANLNTKKESKRQSILEIMNQKKSSPNNDNKINSNTIDETKNDEYISYIKSDQSVPNLIEHKTIPEVNLPENKNTPSELNLKGIESNSESDESKVEQVSTSDSLNNHLVTIQNETNSKLLNESQISKENSFLNNTYNQSNPQLVRGGLKSDVINNFKRNSSRNLSKAIEKLVGRGGLK